MKVKHRKKNKTKPKRIRRWHVMLSLLPEGHPLIGVEIGVRKAECSIKLLEARPLLMLHLVDPWEEYTAEDSANYGRLYSQDKKNVDYRAALENIKPFGDRAIVHKMTSMQAADVIQGELDFVFVDGNHSYEHTSFDINEWWEHLRPGGWMAIHDYNTKYRGVVRAVNEFVGKIDTLVFTGADDLIVLHKGACSGII